MAILGMWHHTIDFLGRAISLLSGDYRAAGRHDADAHALGHEAGRDRQATAQAKAKPANEQDPMYR